MTKFNFKSNSVWLIALFSFIFSSKLVSQGNTCGTATSISSNATCINTAGTTVGAAYNSNAANGGTPGCASPGAPDVWYIFTPTATATYTIMLTAGTITDSGMSLYTGACGSLSEVACDDDSGPGNMSQIVMALVSGTTYYIRIWEYSSGEGTFSICIQRGAAVVLPPNDNCAGATAFPAIPTNGTCSNLNNQSTANATNSGVTPTGACTSNSGSPDDDVWFSFVATATTINLGATWVSGETDVYWQVFSGACGASMTSILCTDVNAGGTLTGLTIGNTYRIRLYSYYSSPTVQNICLSAVVPAANDECSTALPVTTNSSSACTSQTGGTLLGATASAQTNSCGATYDDDDVWYSFVATNTTHNIALNNVAGNNTDLYHSVYSGSCGSISGALVCSDPNTSSISGLTIGATYYIRVYTWGTTTGANTTFSVCVTSPPPPTPGVDCIGGTAVCGNASFSGNSSGEGIEEITAANQGCISFSGEQQSSWYFFSPTVGGSLTFTIVTSVDYDFAIWGPYPSGSTPSAICSPTGTPVRCSFAGGGGNTGLGNGAVDNSETAGGDRWVNPLTVTAGQIYILLINNFAADLSSFNLNWGGSAVLDCSLLPVELISFKGKNDGPQNTLEWVTASENNNDYFTLEKSQDGIHFTNVSETKGAGNSTALLQYSSFDTAPNELTYYRLKQTDYDKSFKYSETIYIDRSGEREEISNIYPNPTNDIINFMLTTKSKSALSIELINYTGDIVYKEPKTVDQGDNTLQIPVDHLKNGVYLLKVTIEATGKTSVYKIIKQ